MDRRRGIGSALIAWHAAAGAARDPCLLQCATQASNHAGRRFLASHGFRLLIRTRLGSLDPHLLAPEAWTAMGDAARQVERMGYRIAATSEIARGVGFTRALATFHSEIYRRAHTWNPQVSITAELAWQMFLDPDEVSSHAMIVAISGQDSYGGERHGKD